MGKLQAKKRSWRIAGQCLVATWVITQLAPDTGTHGTLLQGNKLTLMPVCDMQLEMHGVHAMISRG